MLRVVCVVLICWALLGLSACGTQAAGETTLVSPVAPTATQAARSEARTPYPAPVITEIAGFPTVPQLPTITPATRISAADPGIRLRDVWHWEAPGQAATQALVYSTPGQNAAVWRVALHTEEPQQPPLLLADAAQGFYYPHRISPNGRYIAYKFSVTAKVDALYIDDVLKGTTSIITDSINGGDGIGNAYYLWSPDSAHLVLRSYSVRDGQDGDEISIYNVEHHKIVERFWFQSADLVGWLDATHALIVASTAAHKPMHFSIIDIHTGSTARGADVPILSKGRPSFGPLLFDLSPDRQKVRYGTGETSYIYDIASQATIEVAAAPNLSIWMPDSKALLYIPLESTGAAQLITIQDPPQVTSFLLASSHTEYSTFFLLSLSPDGKYVLFKEKIDDYLAPEIMYIYPVTTDKLYSFPVHVPTSEYMYWSASRLP